MKINFSSIYWQLTLPVVVTGLLTMAALGFIVPAQIKTIALNDAISSVENTVRQFQAMRNYYIDRFVKPVSTVDGFAATEQKNDFHATGLPATTSHHLSHKLTGIDTSMELYSQYPYLRRGVRNLDDFQQRAWEYLTRNPEARFIEQQEIDGQQVLRFAVADTMVSEACVNCHNSHADTPKTDWKPGDVRGVLEINRVIHPQGLIGYAVNKIILSIIIISLLVTIGLLWFSFKLNVEKPIHRLSGRLKEISSGDLTQRVVVSGKDEISVLSRCFNHFLDKIHSTISTIVDTASQVVASVSELDNITSTVSQGASRQQQETIAIASAVTEMSATSANVNDSAANAAKETTNADTSAKNGMEIVNQTVEGIHLLSSDVSSAASVIADLAEQADSIGSVLDVIRGIAEQTNLLALNAAIEAARAGEQGRGFAVVADEVRTLASRTQESTEEIQKMIENLQSGTRQAVSVMSESQAHAEKTVEMAATAGQSLNAIVSAISEISNMNHQIAHAVNEQQRTADAVSQNVMVIQTVTEETAISSVAAKQSSDNVSQQVASLQSMMGQFKV